MLVRLVLILWQSLGKRLSPGSSAFISGRREKGTSNLASSAVR
jgi:hypothetical protein